MATPSEDQAAQAAGIPQELRAPDQWVIRDERKQPINAMTGKLASSTDPATWSSFTTAAATGRPLGFVFTEDDPYVGIDLDHCRDPETGAIAPEALAIIERFRTYTEISPSGTGVHLILRGVKPTRDCTMKTPWGKIECYDAGRYFTMTGRTLPGHTVIRSCQRQLSAWYREVFPPAVPERPQSPPPAYAGGSHTVEEVIAAAERVNGDKARRLLAGNIAGYPASHSDPRFSSEADAALVAILCGYTDDDEQVADIWRRSGLYRKKLDRRDYVDRTIASARSRQAWWFDWDRTTGSAGPIRHDAFRHEQAGDTCPAELARAKALNAQQAEQIRTLQERVRLADEREAIQRNTKLGAPRQTGAALASLFREERPREPGTPTPYRMPLAKLAERTGLSADACSRQLKKLAEYRTPAGDPILYTDTRDVPRSVNQETGEITEPHREIWVGPGVDRSAFGYILAQLAPADAPKHGGKPDRNVCPEHPDAGVLRRTKTTRKITRECAHCHLILDVQVIPVGRETTDHIPVGRPIQHHAFTHEGDDPETTDPIQHDAFAPDPAPMTDPVNPIQHDAFAPGSPDPEPGRPMPQDASSIANHSVVRDLSGKMRHSPSLFDVGGSGPAGPSPGWEADHRRVYGALYRGEAS